MTYLNKAAICAALVFAYSGSASAGESRVAPGSATCFPDSDECEMTATNSSDEVIVCNAKVRAKTLGATGASGIIWSDEVRQLYFEPHSEVYISFTFKDGLATPRRRDPSIKITGLVENSTDFTCSLVDPPPVNPTPVPPVNPPPVPPVNPPPLPPDVPYCPKPSYAYKMVGSAGGAYCVDRKHNVLGPQPSAITEACQQEGGGEPCLSTSWDEAFYLSLRGGERCAPGSKYDPSLGFCVEGEDAFGPFPQSMIEKCRKAGGGNPCFTNRWSRNFLKKLKYLH